MDIAFSPEELTFRDEVRGFFDEQFDDELVSRFRGDNFKEAIVEWQQRLYKKGWIAANWPVEHGGTGWTPTQKYIYETERSERGIPGVIYGAGPRTVRESHAKRADERLDLNDLRRATQVVARLLQDLLGYLNIKRRASCLRERQLLLLLPDTA